MTDPKAFRVPTIDVQTMAANNTADSPPEASPVKSTAHPPETGGPKGPDPTRFGDWERKGRCIDF